MYNNNMTVANPLAFVKEVKTELEKVIWPTRAQTVKLTAVVIGLSAIVGIYIGSLDILFIKLVELVIKK